MKGKETGKSFSQSNLRAYNPLCLLSLAEATPWREVPRKKCQEEAQGYRREKKASKINLQISAVISMVCQMLCYTVLSLSVISNSCDPPGSSVHWDFPGKSTGVGGHALLQGIFPTQGLNHVSHIAGRFFTVSATREAQEYWSRQPIPSPGDL